MKTFLILLLMSVGGLLGGILFFRQKLPILGFVCFCLPLAILIELYRTYGWIVVLITGIVVFILYGIYRIVGPRFGMNPNTEDGNTPRFEIDGDKLCKVHSCTSDVITVPDGVRVIGSRAFKETNPATVILPDSVEVIMDHAFSDMTDMIQITLSNQLQVIGRFAFSNCTSLKKIDYPSYLKEIKEYAFCNSGLEFYLITRRVEKIGDYAFKDCKSLLVVDTSISNVKEYGTGVFEGTPDRIVFRTSENDDRWWK